MEDKTSVHKQLHQSTLLV